METETLALAQGIDFSLWGLFARATLTVKFVVLVLIVSSFWSWAIIIQKLITYRAARHEAAVFDRAFWSGEPLDGLFEEIGPQPSSHAADESLHGKSVAGTGGDAEARLRGESRIPAFPAAWPWCRPGFGHFGNLPD